MRGRSRAREAVAMVLLAAPLAAGAQEAPRERSVLDGVYTAHQAERGRAEFEKSCAECHTSSDFQGELFLFAWSGQGIHILYDFIRSSMPDNSPGSLSPAAYGDILAYILKLNSFPSGEKELPHDIAALRRIILRSGNESVP